jgi:putative ABC transport system permease protein
MNLRRFLKRKAADAEQRKELEFYVDVTAEEYLAQGLNPSEARAAARRKLGNPTLIREEIYRMNTVAFVESVLRDARYALRMMRAKPGFSISALLSLALGIGANIAIFSIVNAVLIRPLPYPDSDKLVGVYNSGVSSGQAFRDWPLSLDLYSVYRQNAHCFQEFGVWTAGAATINGLGDPEQIPAVSMTHGVLRALGMHPFLGRWFSSADEARGARRTVILSYAYWRRRFAGDSHALGRLILIDSVPHQVIGVMPRSFVFLNLAPDVLTPELVANDAPGAQDADHNGLARLKPDLTLAQANEDIARVLHIWARTTGAEQLLKQLRVTPNLRPLKQDVVGDVGAVLKILMGALALVLLLVCANVANLVQVRAQARSQEFAIRAALGAGRGRIARELLVESFTLGTLGGAMGFGLAYVGLHLLVIYGPTNLPRIGEISIDSTSLLFAFAASLVSSVLFGLITVLKLGLSRRVQNARGASPGAEQLRTQNALVVTQVALALVLLIADGLLLRSFVALRNVKPGFTHPEQVQTVRLFIPEAQVPEPERVAQMQADILHNLSAIPGVRAVAFATALPLQPEYHNGKFISVEGQAPVDRIPPNRTVKDVSPGLFATLGTRLIAGRDFTWDDLLGRRRVAIVSENMARESWGEPRDAIGRRIRTGNDDPWSVVVGVAENVYDDGMDRQPPTLVYFPAGVRPPYQPGAAPTIRRSVSFAIRSRRAGTAGFLKEMKASVHAVDSSLPLAQLQTLNELYKLSMARTSFALVLLGIAAAMALTLAIIGVYGVLAYAVAQRRREVSIRVALGAEPGMVKALFMRQGLILTCVGGAIGLILARALSRWLSSLLFGVTPIDPLTYSVAGALILAAALSATYIPVRRAVSLDPMEALRSD